MSKVAAVIGAGLVGLITAHALRQIGFNIKIIEKNEVGCEATGNSAGLLFPLNPEECCKEELDDFEYSHAYYRKNNYKTFKNNGIYWHGDLALKKHPFLEVSKRGPQLFFNKGAVLNPRSALLELKEHLSDYIYENQHIVKFILSNDRIVKIITKTNTFEPSIVIICAGARSGQLMAGFPNKVYPIKGHLIKYQPNEYLLDAPMIINNNYVLQHSKDELIVGSSRSQKGFDYSTENDVVQSLEKFAINLLPRLKKFSHSKKIMVGLRPFCDTGVETDFHHRFKNCLWHYGHGYHGISTAPATTKRLIDKIIKNTV